MVTIAIDRGHAGKNPANGIIDPGAVGNGLREADIVGYLGDAIVTRLEAYDVRIYDVPRLWSLTARAEYANERKADFYLSLHCNASNGQGTGFESYIHPAANASSVKLQDGIHKLIMLYLEAFGVKDRGKKRANFIVLRETKMPALLLECLFIDNPVDARLLQNPEFLNVLANEIAWALVQSLGLQKKPDPCKECDLRKERDKLFDEVTRLRQALKEAHGVLSRVVF